MTKATVTVLEGGPITFRKELAAIWQYRHFYTFLFHEISMKRYKRTLLGAWWLVIRPLIPAIFRSSCSPRSFRWIPTERRTRFSFRATPAGFCFRQR